MFQENLLQQGRRSTKTGFVHFDSARIAELALRLRGGVGDECFMLKTAALDLATGKSLLSPDQLEAELVKLKQDYAAIGSTRRGHPYRAIFARSVGQAYVSAVGRVGDAIEGAGQVADLRMGAYKGAADWMARHSARGDIAALATETADVLRKRLHQETDVECLAELIGACNKIPSLVLGKNYDEWMEAALRLFERNQLGQLSSASREEGFKLFRALCDGETGKKWQVSPHVHNPWRIWLLSNPFLN